MINKYNRHFPFADCTGNNVGLPSEGIQPLVSNVLAKPMGGGSGGSEAQYMQQQSQIYVFSTAWANKGAEAVMQGQFSTIIAYHCAQPGTKKYLEVSPSTKRRATEPLTEFLVTCFRNTPTR